MTQSDPQRLTLLARIFHWYHDAPRGSVAWRWSVVMAVLVTPIFAIVAVACQYTVRDIGFVDLRGPEYTLVLPGSLNNQDKIQLRSRLAWLSDTNCQLLFQSSESPESPSSVDANQRWQAELVDGQGRRIVVAQADDQPVAEEVSKMLRDVFTTPVMSELTGRTIDSFAQIVIVQGSDPEANQKVRRATEAAMLAIRKLEPMLPRPLAKPVAIVSIAYDQRSTESLLLWSLGLEELADRRSAVALIYGRGKLAGKVLMDDAISDRELLAQLALVGESCECETDRRWSEEPVLPVYWSAEFRARAAGSLGFDPDSPLVRAEVVRIVGRGSQTDQKQSGRDDRRPDAIEQLLLGYAENELNHSQEAAAPNPDLVQSEPGQVNATVVAGGGWDFEPESGPVGGTVSEALNEHDDAPDQKAISPPPATMASPDSPVNPFVMITWVFLGFTIVSVLIAVSIPRKRGA